MIGCAWPECWAPMPEPLRCVRQTALRSWAVSRLIWERGEKRWLERLPPLVSHPAMGGAVSCWSVKAGAGVMIGGEFAEGGTGVMTGGAFVEGGAACACVSANTNSAAAAAPPAAPVRARGLHPARSSLVIGRSPPADNSLSTSTV